MLNSPGEFDLFSVSSVLVLTVFVSGDASERANLAMRSLCASCSVNDAAVFWIQVTS